MDSLIRAKQLNQPDVSGFISQVMYGTLPTSGIDVGGDIIPTGSGIYNLGSNTNYYETLYVNGIDVPSGSGINFGNDFFTARVSGANAILSVGGITISSADIGASIIGPTGPTGPSGYVGPTGATGLYVTGAYKQGSSVVFVLSNGGLLPSVALPSGATGPTGVSVTGFLVNGTLMSPQFSNGSTGTAFSIPSGQKGDKGDAGGILIDCNQFTGLKVGEVAPSVQIFNVNPFASTNPPLNMIRGMAYSIGLSGLNLSTVVISGNTYNGDFFTDENGLTGFLKFGVWNDTILTSIGAGNTHSGRFVNGETSVSYSTVSAIESSNAWDFEDDNILNQEMSFNLRWSANDAYKYGFYRCHLDGSMYGSTDKWGFYILGDLDCNFFGPTGPSGMTGPTGPPGPQGQRGAAGIGGVGTSVTGIQTATIAGVPSVSFLLSDGTALDYVPMPQGGPTGPAGATGATGAGITGPTGPTGATGSADKYYASFTPDSVTSHSGTLAAIDIDTGGGFVTQTGVNRKFQAGNRIRFVCSAMVGLAYTPGQTIVFADSVTGTTLNFYAIIESFNSINGEIVCDVLSSPAPVGMVGGYMQWFSFTIIDTNLGGLGSPGPTGPAGATGPTGNTGHQVFNPSSMNNLNGTVISIPNVTCTTCDIWNLTLNGPDNYINFDFTNFDVGETIIVRITNGSSFLNTNVPSLIHWDANAKFPYGTSAPGPNPGRTSLYTFVRFADEGGNKIVFCTYSMDYQL